jgi:glycosyltransferase involved in cell wall biosynthesis
MPDASADFYFYILSAVKVIAVLPAYNAEKTLEKTIRDIPAGSVDEIILVDDCSKDGTAALARKLGLTTIVHERNKGYGGNQKTCYEAALKRGADIVIMIHPDYQYDARLAPIMAALISNDICDFVCGSRIRTRWEALKGGMPVYKYFFNRALTIVENSLTGQNLGEWHSGLRAYSRKTLETIPWHLNSDDFVFDQQFLIQAAAMKIRIGDVPTPVRYFPEASSISFRRSCVYGFSALYYLAQFLLQQTGLFSFELLTPKKAA